ncbi:hypothetical protein D9M69_449640 [compost metagenome]
MAHTGDQVVKQCGQEAPNHQLGQRTGQVRLDLLEAFLGAQRHVEREQQHGNAEEEDDARDTMQDGRVSSDGEFDGPEI